MTTIVRVQYCITLETDVVNCEQCTLHILLLSLCLYLSQIQISRKQIELLTDVLVKNIMITLNLICTVM